MSEQTPPYWNAYGRGAMHRGGGSQAESVPNYEHVIYYQFRLLSSVGL
jgi:hypothetical protein